jgi:hypothetical protein
MTRARTNASKQKKMTQAEARRFLSRRSGANDLDEMLASHGELQHLRVKQRGGSLTLVSGPEDDEIVHAKLTSLGRDVWGLSFPTRGGRWERTPFLAPLDELAQLLIDGFGWHLVPR